jgi:hypothetical protein
MSNRLAAGFTIAGFPLTAALLAITAGNYLLGAGLGLLFVAGSLLTVAPKLPLLHRLPVVGAPKITAGFKANGSVEFGGPPERPRVTLAVSRDAFPCSVFVQIGITNHSDQDVSAALINFGAPARHGLQICDGWGAARDAGQQMPPTHEGFDYWAIDDYRLSGRDGRLLYFRFRVSEPGTYSIFASISSRALYRELNQWAEVEITARAETELCLRDRLGSLIDRGELLARQIPERYTGDSASRQAYLTWFIEVFNAFSEADPEREVFQEVRADWPGDRSGDAFYLAELAAKVKYLYELRDLLGHR